MLKYFDGHLIIHKLNPKRSLHPYLKQQAPQESNKVSLLIHIFLSELNFGIREALALCKQIQYYARLRRPRPHLDCFNI